MTDSPGGSVEPPSTKREMAERAIRNAIESGVYVPGQVISQRQIGEDLNLSVTPMREALIGLTSNGIVERHSHHSVRVARLDADRLTQIFHVRRLLEEDAIAQCALSATDALLHHLEEVNGRLRALIDAPDAELVNTLDRSFHTSVFSACGNEALVWAIDKVKSSFPMYALWLEPGRLKVSVSEHAALIECLRTRDVAGAVEMQRDHLEGGLRATITFVSRFETLP